MTVNDTNVACDNCDWKGNETDDCMGLYIDSLADRLDPGSEIPAGECPECGCLAYLIKSDEVPDGDEIGALVEAAQFAEGVLRELSQDDVVGVLAAALGPFEVEPVADDEGGAE